MVRYIVLKTIIFARFVYQDFQILPSYSNIAFIPISFTERDNLLLSNPLKKQQLRLLCTFMKMVILLYTETRIRNVLHNSVPLYSVLCAVLYHDILSGQWLVDHRYFHWNDYAKRAWSDRLRIWHNLMQSFVVRNTLANRILEFPEYLDLGVWIHNLRTPNKGIYQRNLKIWANVADKLFLGRT